jgi:hypothetical protein
MDNAERDRMLTEIHGDVKVVKAQQQSQTEQVSDLYSKLNAQSEQLTKVKTKQDTCPALEAYHENKKIGEDTPANRIQKKHNKLVLLSLVLFVVFNMMLVGLTIYKVHLDARTIERVAQPEEKENPNRVAQPR